MPDRREYVIGGFGPFERLCIVVSSIDEGVDGGFEFRG